MHPNKGLATITCILCVTPSHKYLGTHGLELYICDLFIVGKLPIEINMKTDEPTILQGLFQGSESMSESPPPIPPRL